MTADSGTTVATKPKLSQGQSQWKLIWREFRKRRMALTATGVVLVLVTISIFAPLLANGAPIYYVGFNRFEYQEASRTVRASLTQLMETRSGDTPNADISRFLKTIALQIRLMADALSAEKGEELRAIGDKIVVAAQSTDVAASTEKLKQALREIRSGFDAKEVTLVSKSHWPVIASLASLDAGFVMANLLLLTSPIWFWLMARFVPDETSRARKLCLMAVQVGIPLASGLVWYLMVPVRVDRTDYKAGVLMADEGAKKAPVVFETVMWAPIAYGLDEYDLAQKSAAPEIYRLLFRANQENDVPTTVTSPRWGGLHWLGTDASGRDVLCRLMWGGRVSLSVGLVAVAIYVSIGIVIGALAGYFRGICDLIISRLIEVMICFPTFFLILTIVAFFGPSIVNIMLIIGLTGWTGIARLVRGEFLRLVDQEFVLAGRALGYSPLRIIFRHVLPNAMAPVLVSATFGIAGAILTESALSFLGLGISKPTPSWGGLLADGRDSLQHAPWLIHFPGLAIFITITCYNLMGEALRDASDPRLRGSR